MPEKTKLIFANIKFNHRKIHLWYYCTYGLILLLLLLTIFTRTNVNRNKTYETKEEIALYLYKYDELPSNFITKDEWHYDYSLIRDGKSVGGDEHRYENNITDYTKHETLKECDIYTSRLEIYENGKRGEKRLVYAINESNDEIIEVFYTDNHYETFSKISRYSINGLSNTCLILLLLIIPTQAGYVFIMIKKLNKSKEDLLEECKYTLKVIYLIICCVGQIIAYNVKLLFDNSKVEAEINESEEE